MSQTNVMLPVYSHQIHDESQYVFLLHNQYGIMPRVAMGSPHRQPSPCGYDTTSRGGCRGETGMFEWGNYNETAYSYSL